MDKKYTQTRISPSDLEWLRSRANRNHRTPPEELAAIRELVETLGIDVLPHPADSDHVIPVITRLTSKK
jgi:hypothetical protein